MDTTTQLSEIKAALADLAARVTKLEPPAPTVAEETTDAPATPDKPAKKK